jgi:hypothetical protein
MIVVWLGLALLIVFVIAAVVVGREATRLRGEPPRPVFDLEEAVEWVAAHVPFEVSAALTHDDVRSILRWNLEYFRTRGVSGNGSAPPEASDTVVVGGAETVDHVLARARQAGLEVDATQVHAVLEAQMTYLEAIGALGRSEDPPPPG